jgi:hypothetical protein
MTSRRILGAGWVNMLQLGITEIKSCHGDVNERRTYAVSVFARARID